MDSHFYWSIYEYFKYCKKFQECGSVENRKRSGRPKIVTNRDYRQLGRNVKINRRDE
jgi:hypothetical protein